MTVNGHALGRARMGPHSHVSARTSVALASRGTGRLKHLRTYVAPALTSAFDTTATSGDPSLLGRSLGRLGGGLGEEDSAVRTGQIRTTVIGQSDDSGQVSATRPHRRGVAARLANVTWAAALIVAACTGATPTPPTGAITPGAITPGAATAPAPAATGTPATTAVAVTPAGTVTATVPGVSQPPVSEACSGTPKTGGTVAVINDGGGTNPITMNEVLIWNIFDALLQQDITGALHPGIAETYDVSSDGLTYTFHLRKNAMWTDGNPVDSADVAFTYEKVLDPDITAANAQFFTGVLTSIKAVDQWTVQFVLTHPYSQIVQYFAQQRIAPQRLFKPLSDQEINTKYTQDAPITSGPFKVQTVVPNQVVKTVRNDAYYFPQGSNDYRTVPYVDGLDFYPFGDPQANVISMQNGTRDVYALTMTLPEYQQISVLKNLTTTVHPVGIYNYLWLNNQNPLFSDVSVRQAMVYAIDRQTIVDQLLSPIATVMTSFIDPSSSVYDPNLPQYGYDAGKAKSMLAAAGWTPGADGILTKDGQRFSFTTIVTTATFGVQVIEPIQEYLKAVGIEMKVRGISGTSVTQAELTSNMQSGEFVAAETNDGYEVYPDRRHRWLSTLVPPKGNNFARYQNPELDALLNDAEAKPEGSPEQTADYMKIQEILWNDVPVIPMYYPLMVQAVNNAVCGAEQGSVYILQTASKWWVQGR